MTTSITPSAAMNASRIAATARAEGISVADVVRRTEEARAYAALSPKEKIAADARLLAQMRGCSIVEALRRLGVK